jgi:multidrug efflux pump subunit AcrA (membrane-fusion protein)
MKRVLFFLSLGATLLGIVAGGLAFRAKAAVSVERETLERAVPMVSVAQPIREDGTTEVVLPGSIQAFTDAPIYARTNGYLKCWYVDIGARVKAGQLLAEVDTPEVHQQLEQARADLAAALRITAPFDGVITARNTDVGALVEVGNGTGRELFHLAAIDKLRVYVNVPQTYSRTAVPGVEAELALAELPGRRFKGTLVRTARAIDPTSRTLLAEIAVDNATGDLLPGAYAQVRLLLGSGADLLFVPATALLFRPEGPRVAVVRDGKAELVAVTLGRDLGGALEIASGLVGNEVVVLNPPDSLVSGQAVRVAPGNGEIGQ